MLQRLGYQVTVFTNSAQALGAFLAHPDRFDVVVTDQTMPRLTGVQLAKKLLSARPSLPIILISGFSELITGTKVKQLGIRHYLMKPLVGGELAAAIRQVLDNRNDKQEEG